MPPKAHIDASGVLHHIIIIGIEHKGIYVLNLFGPSLVTSRRAYAAFVARGVAKGRRPDFVGGGLLRSVCGWPELKEFRDSGIRIIGDERILGSSDYVEAVLKQANKDLQQKYRLAAAGLDFDKLLKNEITAGEIRSRRGGS